MSLKHCTHCTRGELISVTDEKTGVDIYDIDKE